MFLCSVKKKFLATPLSAGSKARYQEYKNEVARTLNRDNTLKILEQTKQLHAWILERLKEKSLTR